ncbi:MAG: type II toxin-antitoxin system CcdA family antitoxin [Sporichthyaceae bacterium]
MAKRKVSVTLSPERIESARAALPHVTLSELLDEALQALVDRELERRWLAGHAEAADLPGEVPVDLSDVPWDAE